MWWIYVLCAVLFCIGFIVGFLVCVFRLPTILANLSPKGLDMLADRVARKKERFG